MSFLLEDMIVIKNTENDIKEQEENLQEIKKQLEEIFKSKDATIPKEDFIKFFLKVETAFKKLENSQIHQINSKAKSKIYENIYNDLKKIKHKHSDFIPKKLIAKFVELEMFFGWQTKLHKASSIMENIELQKLNQQKDKELNFDDFKKYFVKFYQAIYLMLEALEKYSVGAEEDEIQRIKHFSEDIIIQIKPSNSISINKKILTTAKAILWEIEQQKKQRQNTVGSLLDFLQTSPGWIGDDFEECLEYVNEVRRE